MLPRVIRDNMPNIAAKRVLVIPAPWGEGRTDLCCAQLAGHGNEADGMARNNHGGGSSQPWDTGSVSWLGPSQVS